MVRGVDDIVSLVLALSVTALFAGQTLMSWPGPFDLRKFDLQYDNPITTLRHMPNQRIALNSEPIERLEHPSSVKRRETRRKE